MNFDAIPLDYRVIYQIVESGARVLDLGCGSGELLYLLAKEKNAKLASNANRLMAILIFVFNIFFRKFLK